MESKIGTLNENTCEDECGGQTTPWHEEIEKNVPKKPEEKPAPPPEPPAPGQEKPIEKPVEKPGPLVEAPINFVEVPNNPKAFNAKFEGWSDEQVKELAFKEVQTQSQFELAKEAHIESIKRADAMFDVDARKQAKESIPLILDALKSGKDITQEGGKPVLSNEPLSPERRLRFHQAILGDINAMFDQTRARIEYSGFLYMHGQYKDAEQVGIAANQFADELPIKMIQQEAKQLQEDVLLYPDPRIREEILRNAIQLTSNGTHPASIDTIPIHTRKFLATLYLGTELKLGEKGASAEFGKSSAFKPDKALEMVKECREKNKEILGFDPLDQNQARKDLQLTSLFGGLAEVFTNPEKYNMYELVGKYQVDKLQKELKTVGAFESMELDVAVTFLAAGMLGASRNPKAQAMLEKVMAGALPGSEKAAPMIAKMTGLAATAIGAPLARNYGSELIFGRKESLLDSSVHVAGSLAAAELGGRILGKGSLLTGKPGIGPSVFNQFDKAGSAKWLSMHGYDTTGKLSGVLLERGYVKEGAALGALPTGTTLTSEAGLKALEQAGITHDRFANVAGIVAKDLGISSGIDASKLAKALESGASGKKLATIDDVATMLKQERQLMESFLQKIGKCDLKATPAQALADAGHAGDLEKYSELLNKFGVKNVDEAYKVFNRLSKGMQSEFPQLAMLQQKGVAGSTKLVDAANMTNRALDGPGVERLLDKLPASERGNVLYDRLAEEMSTNLSSGRTRIQQAVQEAGGARFNGASFFDVQTGQALNKSRWGSAFLGSGAIAGTYNSTAKTWDLMGTDNPQTGKPYTFHEAFNEAHLPTVLDESKPDWMRKAASILWGTPGQTIMGTAIMRPGALYNASPLPTPYKMFDALPFSPRFWNNLNSYGHKMPAFAGSTAFAGSLWPVTLESANRNNKENSRIKELLKNSQRPIENEAPKLPR